ncbi:hypothetical protein H6P81_008261 [Aristolochia fimbriata]|uniref:UFSP1/2/DUB catalytic domain-containing protein n=1 Tax=Aristolochia fimbriata TaxID=158543 RepID=A0AAV7F6E5_ARIFI|nr:hypothetical protein H6P81_008261 [Aristolochia fimbriata]
MSSSCPFCNLPIPLSELESHVNDHLVEEEFARDLELALAISLPSSPPRHTSDQLVEKELQDDFEIAQLLAWESSPPRPKEKAINSENTVQHFSGDILHDRFSASNGESTQTSATSSEEKIDTLSRLQIRGVFYRIEGGLMTLLRNCLELENGRARTVVTGHVDHFQSLKSEDSGWGCGWRNIQMLSSHLLHERHDVREVMFGGSQFVPDIPSLQRWLEIAWEAGFDIPGSRMFNNRIYGSKKWIGTTECATLLRLFGLRARIVDFTSTEAEMGMGFDRGAKRKRQHVYGPMDKFLSRNCSGTQVHPIKQASSVEMNSMNRDKHDRSNKGVLEIVNGRKILADWVCNYFHDSGLRESRMSERVTVSGKTPLYFQHNGHSRTIVGIQIQTKSDGTPEGYSLLVLDPAHSTAALEKSLRENNGWQRFVKRGLHTLRKPQYQLCYVEPGIAHGEEKEQLKTINSVLFAS